MPENMKSFPVELPEKKKNLSASPAYNGSVAADDMAVAAAGSDASALALLEDLRVQFESLRRDVAATVAHRAEQAAQVAADGAEGLRTQIRAAPVVSLAVAAVVGGLIAVLLTQRSREPGWLERAASYRPSLPDIGLKDAADRMRRSADATYESVREQASGIMPSVERLAQTLSTMDASAFTPAIEKGTSLFKSIWGSFAPGAKS